MATKKTDDRDRGLHRHGKPNPKNWEKSPTFAQREQKTPAPNTTFAERRAERSPRKKADTDEKQQTSAENKAVTGAEKKSDD